MNDRTPRQRYLARHKALLSERGSWDAHWRDLSEQFLPRRSRFLAGDRNLGGKKHSAIINNTPTKAVRTLAAGMMAGITSPSRPWFMLTVSDPRLRKSGAVKLWLEEVVDTIRLGMAKANIYNCLHNVYTDLPVIGTSAMLLEADEADGMRGYVLPVGQYALANSDRLEVDTLYRTLSFTNAQLASKFGLEACSPRVREALKRGHLDAWVEVLHVVEPNVNYEKGKLGPTGKRFRSVWMETAADDTHRSFLRESGYSTFPVLAPRWDVTGEDVYGSSPGMDALGDARALQALERKAGQVAAKIVEPPMRGPMSLMNQPFSLLPGALTLTDVTSGGQRFEPAMEVSPLALQVLEAKIREHERRVGAVFLSDLWLMMTSGDNPQQTAREVAERHEEKMMQLGPVLERLQGELLDPLIEWAFSTLAEAHALPPTPQELQGAPLRVEYVSILAQAQKMLGSAGVERFASFAGNIAAVQPEVLDKLDADALLDVYAEMLGTPAKVLKSPEVVAKIRGARAEAAQAQAAAETAGTVAEGAKTLSEADMGGDTALTRLLGGLGGPVPGGGPAA